MGFTFSPGLAMKEEPRLCNKGPIVERVPHILSLYFHYLENTRREPMGILKMFDTGSAKKDKPA